MNQPGAAGNRGKVPTDRAIDGVDQSEFLPGKSEPSRRDGVVVYVGNEIYGAKWKNWKMTTRELEAGTDVIKDYAIPRLFNLNLDPREEHALSYQYKYFWVRFALGKIMTDYLASLRTFPLDEDVVWEVVTSDLPPLVAALERILGESR